MNAAFACRVSGRRARARSIRPAAQLRPKSAPNPFEQKATKGTKRTETEDSLFSSFPSVQDRGLKFHADNPIRPPRCRAFSLVELMVVVGIVAFVALGLGMALKDTGGNALATAQTTLATLVGTARAQAAVHQTQAMLLIYGSRPPAGDAQKFLRLMQVFRDETPTGASRTWVPAGSAVELPQGVFLVPPATVGLIAPGVVWPTNPPLLSTVGMGMNPNQPVGTPFGGGNPAAFFVQFNSDGTVSQVGNQAYARLVVATATRSTANLPQFNNAGAVRGLLIRPSGAITFVNDALSF